MAETLEEVKERFAAPFREHKFKAMQNVRCEGRDYFVLWPLLAQVYGKPTIMYALCEVTGPVDQKPIIVRETALEECQ